MNSRNVYIWIFIGILIIAAAFLSLYLPNKVTSFVIKDRCGPMLNFISHTVQNEGTCRAQCKSQCGTMDLNYKKVEFQENTTSCNSCICYCKEPLY